jgi:hypothetical protein
MNDMNDELKGTAGMTMLVALVSNVELSYIPDNPFRSKTLEYHVSSTLESKQETVDM